MQIFAIIKSRGRAAGFLFRICILIPQSLIACVCRDAKFCVLTIGTRYSVSLHTSEKTFPTALSGL